jgi:trimeric autotransporter adhesin
MKRTLLCLAFGLLMLPVILHAGQKHSAPTSNPVTLLKQFLHPDGSLNLPNGFKGQIDVNGWKMLAGKNGAPRFVSSSSSEDTLWEDCFGVRGANDEVRCAVADGAGNIYIGGDFTGVGNILANNIAKWDGTHWSVLGKGVRKEGGNSHVAALVLDSGGNLYAGGCFDTAGSVPAYNIAMWNGTYWLALGGGLTGFEDNTDGYEVYALAVTSNDMVYAGGSFTYSGYATMSYVSKWNETAWEGLGSGLNSYVNALTVGALDTLFVGGAFTTAGGNGSIRYLGAWSGSAWSNVGGSTFSAGIVHTLYWGPDAKLYVGSLLDPGSYNTSIVRTWNGTAWATLGPSFIGFIKALHFDGSGNLYMGGVFGAIGSTAVNNIARWDGAAWTQVGEGIPAQVWTLAAMGSDLFIGGIFDTIGTTVATRIVKWDGASYSALYTTGKGEGLSGDNPLLYSLAADGHGNIYAGGAFAIAGGTITNYVARWDGTRWWSLGSVSGYVVTSLIFDSLGNLYAGGEFDTIGGVAANSVAKWDGIQWSHVGPGIKGLVNTLTIDPHGTLYAGGEFDSSGGVAMSGIAKWNGSAWEGVGGGLDDHSETVYSIVCDSVGNVYAGGDFISIGGVTVTAVAKWNDTVWSPVGTIMPGPYSTLVFRLCFGSDGRLYAGGVLSFPGGYNLGVWDGVRWTGLGDLDAYSMAYGLNTDREGHLYVGLFTLTSGFGSSVRVWNGEELTTLGSGITNTASPASAVVGMVDAGDGTIFMGGMFNAAGGKLSSSIARLHKLFTINATAGPGGIISDAGAQQKAGGYSYLYSFTPGPGNCVDSIYVDGVYAGDSLSYRFEILNAPHTIHVVFASAYHTINAAVNGTGNIVPAGAVSVANKGSQSFSFTTTIGYQLKNIIVDGDTLPPADHYLFTYVKAPHAITAVFETIPRYAVRYRTFKYDSLIVNKAIKKKNVTTYFEFLIFNSTLDTVNEINMVLSANVAEILETGGMSSLITKNSVQLTGALPSGHSFILKGRLAKPKWALIKKLWFGPTSGIISLKDMQPMYQTYELPKPNAANVREDLYLRWLQAQGGLLVGIARTDTLKTSGWVKMKKPGDLLKTLFDKTGLHSEINTGFVTIGGKPFVKAQGNLPPSKHNNQTFANLLTLKFNMYLSQLGITQPGFGEIQYVQEGSPFAGLLISQIASQGDSMMTLARWSQYAEHPELYGKLDTALMQINAAFSAPFDTVNWSDSLKLKDVIPLIDAVSYLQPTDLPPVTVAQNPSLYVEEEEEAAEQLPTEYALHQNYPNPFNPTTQITFDLPMPMMVTMKVYNNLGQEIMVLVNNEQMDVGVHEIQFDGSKYASGVYFYEMAAVPLTNEAGDAAGQNYINVKKMLLIK